MKRRKLKKIVILKDFMKCWMVSTIVLSCVNVVALEGQDEILGGDIITAQEPLVDNNQKPLENSEPIDEKVMNTENESNEQKEMTSQETPQKESEVENSKGQTHEEFSTKQNTTIPEKKDVVLENDIQSDYMRIYSKNRVFDIQGRVDKSEAYKQTTYGNNGYKTELSIDGQVKSLNSVENGKKILVDKDIYAQITYSIVNDVVKVTYTLYNEGSTSQNVKIGSHTDIQIGDSDSAKLQKTESGWRMISNRENDQGLQFNLICKNNETPVDTTWGGRYYDASDNVFNDHWEDVENVDSGIAYSWTKDVPSNGSVSMSVKFVVGSSPRLNDEKTVITKEANKIKVVQPYTDIPGTTSQLYYALDGGEAKMLGTPTHNTSAQSQITASFDIPSNWDFNSLHTLKLWVENDRYASSQENLLHIVYKGTSTHNQVAIAQKYTISYKDQKTLLETKEYYECEQLTLLQVNRGKGWIYNGGEYPFQTHFKMPAENIIMQLKTEDIVIDVEEQKPAPDKKKPIVNNKKPIIKVVETTDKTQSYSWLLGMSASIIGLLWYTLQSQKNKTFILWKKTK